MIQKNIFIRVDSGSDVGLGHVMRCFALAESINTMNFNVYFISKKIRGNIIKRIENDGYKVFHLNSKVLKSSKLDWKMDALETTKIIQRFKNEKNFPKPGSGTAAVCIKPPSPNLLSFGLT